MVLYFACIRENSLPSQRRGCPSQRRDGCGLPITEEGLPITEEGLPVTGEGWVWAAKLSCEDYVHKL